MSNIKEKPPDDYFKCIKIPIKNVLKHYDINLPKITDAVLMLFVICLSQNWNYYYKTLTKHSVTDYV